VATGGIAAASFAAGAIDAAAIAADAIGSSELAATAASEIATAVRTELATELGRVDATISSRASQASVDTIDDLLDTEVAAIKAKTDQLAFTTANRVDAQVFGMEAGTVTAAAVATNAIDADALAADAVAEIADQVWEEAIADHSGTAGSTAEQLAAAGAAGDPWATALPGAYGAGTAGKIVGDNLNATVSSRATQTSVDTIDDLLDTEVAAILADTNELQTDWANGGRLDNILDARASQASVDTVDTVVDAIKVTTDKLDDTLEDDAGTFRFTTNALEQAPSGGATVGDIADAVWDEAIADHLTAGSTGNALNNATAAGNPWEAVIEGSLTAEDLLRIIAAFAAGKTSISVSGSTATVIFRDVTDATDILTGTVVGSERTAVTLNP
jgi:hypothetical protein